MNESCLKLSGTFSAFDFHENKSKILPKFWSQPENVKNSGIFLTFSTLDGVCWKSTVYFRHIPSKVENVFEYYQKYTGIFDIFQLIFVKFCENDSKKGQNWQKLYREFQQSTLDRQLLTCDRLLKMYWDYSLFYFCDRWYNFAKLLKNPKLLGKCMALVCSLCMFFSFRGCSPNILNLLLLNIRLLPVKIFVSPFLPFSSRSWAVRLFQYERSIDRI